MVKLEIDEVLLEAVVNATNAGLQMAGLTPKPVGYSTLPARSHEIAVVIGMVGRRNGTVTLHLSRRAVVHLANKFMEGDAEDINEEVFDAVGEITNIVAGRLKAELGTEEYGISNISCPSMIVGADYHMYHFRGFKSVSVEFELQGVPAILLADRLFSTTISLSQT